MRVFISLLLFTTFTSSILSQTRDNVWFDGKVTLMTGEVLLGKINYNIREQSIQVKQDTVIQVFSEVKIKDMTLAYEEFKHEFLLVAVKDETSTIRTILSELIYQSDKNYSYFKRHQADTEVIDYYGVPGISVGPLNVGLAVGVKRQLRANNNKDSFTSYENDLSRRSFIPLLINYEGEKVILRRKSFFETLVDKKKEVKKLMRDNQLKLYNDEDIVKILEFYDTIKN